MKEPGNAGALQTIRSHLLQAATKGDTAALEGHMAVYMAILKAAGHGDVVDMCGNLAVQIAIARAQKEQCAVKGRG